ncbi:MAG: hypothetical protein RLZZ175_3234 [Bacteroidota bacterium]|jgi:hypothetical protein
MIGILRKILVLTFLTLVIALGNIYAQEAEDLGKIKLADKNLVDNKITEAIGNYTWLWKKKELRSLINNNYQQALRLDKNYKYALKISKQIEKQYPEEIIYKAQSVYNYILLNDSVKAYKLLDKLINQFLEDDYKQQQAIQYFSEQNQVQLAITYIQKIRKRKSNNFIHSEQLAALYKKNNNLPEHISELVNLLINQPTNDILNTIKAVFQENINNESEYNDLEKALIRKSIALPDAMIINELLYWVYLQKKDYSEAYIQAVAIDKKNGGTIEMLMELLTITADDKPIIASELYQQFNTINKDRIKLYPDLILKGIEIKQKVLNTTYPQDKALIESLLEDYQVFTKTYPQYQFVENTIGYALVYAKNKHDYTKAESILKDLLKRPLNNEQQAKTKMALADVYICTGVLWEASLLYSQAEKLVKDSPLAYEAKLKNARIFYFKGEFLLAQAQLNILKLATTREISNDAIQQAVFILEQLDQDSVSPALKAFAEIEKNIFCNELSTADTLLVSLLNNNKISLLMPEYAILTQADLWFKMNKIDKVIANYQLIISNYSQSILADDAVYKLAVLYQKQNDLKNALKYYEMLINIYPSSIYITQARVDYRKLRGDK